MNWLTIAIISYAFTAVANILDKLILAKYLKAAAIYAFYVGILGIISLIFIPFGVKWEGVEQFAISLITGFGFVTALYIMYSAFLRGETTKVATIIGGSLPIYTFILSFLFLGERLFVNEIIAFVFLIAGMVIIGWESKPKIHWWQRVSHVHKRKRGYLSLALISGLIFSLTFVLSKYVYDNQGFISGFFWMRIGTFVGALLILLVPKWRKLVREDLQAPKKSQGKGKTLLITNQIIGALGFLLLNYAISLGSVTLINAMQGLQYVFIFIISVIMGRFIAEVREEYTPSILVQKILGIIMISTGLIFLAL